MLLINSRLPAGLPLGHMSPGALGIVTWGWRVPLVPSAWRPAFSEAQGSPWPSPSSTQGDPGPVPPAPEVETALSLSAVFPVMSFVLPGIRAKAHVRFVTLGFFLRWGPAGLPGLHEAIFWRLQTVLGGTRPCRRPCQLDGGGGRPSLCFSPW